MRRPLLSLAGVSVCALLTVPSLADELPVAAAPSPASQLCVDVRISGDSAKYFSCLNAELAGDVQRQADRTAQLQTVVDASQPSTPTRLGLYNQTATRERLAGNFGKSVYPQRPPAPHYVNPLIH